SGNPGSGNALILASNTNAAPTGYLIDLQSGSSPTSKFKVDASGNVTATGALTVSGTYNTNTFTGSSLTFGSASAAGVDSANGQDLNVGTTNAKGLTLGNTSMTDVLALQGGTAGISLITGASGGTAGSITIGNTTGANSQTINVGTNATASSSTTVNIGSAIGASSVAIHGGTGSVSIDNQGTGAINIANNAVNSVVNIGKTGSTGSASTINLATSNAIGQTINIGGTGGASTDSNSGTAITLQAGSAELDMTNSGTIFKSYTNSATAFQVQNNSATAFNVFAVDTVNNQIVLGSSNNTTGKIAFEGNTGTAILYLKGPDTPDAGNYTLNIPAITANDVICTNSTRGSGCSNYAPTSGDGNYIQNQYTAQQTAPSNYWISGTGRADTSILSPQFDRATAGTLSIGTDTTNTTGLTLGNSSMTSALGIQAGTGGLALSTNGASSNITIRGLASGASIGIGDNSGIVQTINIGNTTGTSGIAMHVASGNFTLDGVGDSNYTLGASTVGGNITIGGSAQTGSINIGNGNANQTLTFGTNASAGNKTVTVGSTTGSSSLTLNAGSGTLLLNGGTGAITLQNQGTGAINIANNSIDSIVNIGKTGTTSNATTINLATSTAGAGSINVGGTGGAGNSNSGTIVTLQGGASQLQIANGGSVFSGVVSQSGGTVSINASGASSVKTASGALTITSNQAATWSTTNGTLTLQSGSGSVSLGTSTQLTANGNLTIASNSSNTLTLQGGTGGTLITANGTGNTGVVVKTTTASTAAFQVQDSSGNSILLVDGSNRQLRVYENNGTANYALIYYDTATNTANYTANTGTVAVGRGTGDISVTAGPSSAVNITANADSVWRTTAGTLTLQTGGSSDLILSPGSSIVSINGSSVVKLGSSPGDPATCTVGAIIYNTSTQKFRGCQGTTPAWVDLASITPTLQTTYTASTGGTTPEVKVDSTRGGFDIQDADTSLAGEIFGVRASNAGGLGSLLLSVETANNSVQIGSSTGHSSNPIILVLDNYSSAADPTGLTGAMYYNSTKGKFRCYDGTWRDCMTGFNEITKTADQSTTSTTMQNDNTLSFSMAANTNYVIDAWIPVDDSDVNNSLGNYTFTVPTGAALNISTSNYSNLSGNITCNIISSGQVCSLVTASAVNFIQVRGFIRNGSTAGSLNFQFAQKTTSVNAYPVIKAGAVMTWRTAD
ncbi:MAG TPA: hypothetical protein VFP35_04570, partial [Candidatus Saccharimonadales bacterium]|nr:hypothetical protein [Candidatus Saccharimonadales bacterium]